MGKCPLRPASRYPGPPGRAAAPLPETLPEAVFERGSGSFLPKLAQRLFGTTSYDTWFARRELLTRPRLFEFLVTSRENAWPTNDSFSFPSEFTTKSGTARDFLVNARLNACTTDDILDFPVISRGNRVPPMIPL